MLVRSVQQLVEVCLDDGLLFAVLFAQLAQHLVKPIVALVRHEREEDGRCVVLAIIHGVGVAEGAIVRRLPILEGLLIIEQPGEPLATLLLE